MVSNVKEILLNKVNRSKYFAIKIAETIVITNMSQLLCYVTYEDSNAVSEDMLFCEPLHSHTTGEYILGKLNEFINKNGIDWRNE